MTTDGLKVGPYFPPTLHPWSSPTLSPDLDTQPAPLPPYQRFQVLQTRMQTHRSWWLR